MDVRIHHRRSVQRGRQGDHQQDFPLHNEIPISPKKQEAIGRATHSNWNLPSVAAEQLIKLTNDNGGRDNVSIIVVRVLDSFPAHAGVFDKVRNLFRQSG
jgi:hypothetical protein